MRFFYPFVLTFLALPACASVQAERWLAGPSYEEDILFDAFAVAGMEFMKATGEKVTFAEIEHIWKFVLVEFVSDSWDCNYGGKGKCRGEVIALEDHFKVKVKAAPCIAKTAFVHEALHIYSLLYLEDIDAAHENRKVFDDRRPSYVNMDSAEVKANIFLVNEGVCGIET